MRVLSRRQGKEVADIQWRSYIPQNDESLHHALADCYAVVNLAGILNQRLFHHRDFYYVHVHLVKQILSACRVNRIQRYLHMSALNADPHGVSEYLRTKGEGELLAHGYNDIQTSSFYPSVIFGPGDGLLNRFARLLRFAPPVFPLACADTLFAPVYVKDVAVGIADSLQLDNTKEKVALCGPDQYTLREIVEYVAVLINRNIKVINLPAPLAKIQAFLLEIIPGKPFSLDNYRSLQLDSVCPVDTQLCQTKLKDVGASCLKL